MHKSAIILKFKQSKRSVESCDPLYTNGFFADFNIFSGSVTILAKNVVLCYIISRLDKTFPPIDEELAREDP